MMPQDLLCSSVYVGKKISEYNKKNKVMNKRVVDVLRLLPSQAKQSSPDMKSLQRSHVSFRAGNQFFKINWIFILIANWEKIYLGHLFIYLFCYSICRPLINPKMKSLTILYILKI